MAFEEPADWSDVEAVGGAIRQHSRTEKSKPMDIKDQIREALRRDAPVEVNRINVEANGSEVILDGTVGSWTEREAVERVASSVPGATRIENRIVVRDECGDNDLGDLWIGNRYCHTEGTNKA
jgi:osmotically-inducible protein OsmY